MLPRDFAILVFVCLTWASNFIISKIALTELHTPPLFFSAVRFALVLLATLPWLLPMPRPRWRMLAVGLLMGAGGFGLVSIGLLTASPSSAAVVTQLGVPITALLSVVMLGERISWRRGIGIALAFSGAMAVMWNPSGLSLSYGLIFVLLSAFASALGIVLVKQLGSVQPFQFQAWVGLASAVPLGIASAMLETGQVRLALDAGWWFVATVVYAALAVSLAGHSLFFRLVQKYEANLISTLTLMCPLMAIGLGVVLLGDRFDGRMAAGTAVVLVGVLMIVITPRRGKGRP
ncbi:DMT family transporter [Phreatobacter sp. AB_2022a]|uniref:DMT family transporter n=1 Tax=Phreatobacter sp. AB_2022a TaxID=3003134 RepID=UPI002286FB95|nr:DMT family transporter [Phreatobacter sp. AB_2022a]MCZ0734766.1 DMT family transporter [Phreatobacter sp. AB_2022a]